MDWVPGGANQLGAENRNRPMAISRAISIAAILAAAERIKGCPTAAPGRTVPSVTMATVAQVIVIRRPLQPCC
jgi:hypothetical protein